MEEDPFPPSYEEAIAHVGNGSMHHVLNQSHPQQSHSSSSVSTYNLNNDIQNSDEAEDFDIDAQKTTIQVPNAPGQRPLIQPSAPPSGFGTTEGSFSNEPAFSNNRGGTTHQQDNSFGLRHRQYNSDHQHHRPTAESSATGSIGAHSASVSENPLSGSQRPVFQFPKNPFNFNGSERMPDQHAGGHPGGFGEFPGFGGFPHSGFRPPGGLPPGGFGFPPGSFPMPPNPGFFQTSPPPNPFMFRPPSNTPFLFRPPLSIPPVPPTPPAPPIPPTPPTPPQPPSIHSPPSNPSSSPILSASNVVSNRDIDSQSSIPSEYTTENRKAEHPESMASSIPKNLESLPPNTEEEVASGSSAPPGFSKMMTIPPSAPLTSTAEVHGLMSAHDISKAQYTRTKLGVESNDPLLDDPYQLYRFLVAHNDRPSMHILITGSHIEKRNTEERSSDGTVKVIQQKVKVDDFKMDFDLTPFISTTGTLTAMPDPKTGRQLTLQEIMEEFAEDDNPFKELHIEKKVLWEYENLTRAITHAIREVKYRYTIEISYPITNNRVAVVSSSPIANFMRSNWTKMFCFMSFIGVIAYPLREIYKVVKDKPVKSEFKMNISIHDFFHANYWNIVDQVQYK